MQSAITNSMGAVEQRLSNVNAATVATANTTKQVTSQNMAGLEQQAQAAQWQIASVQTEMGMVQVELQTMTGEITIWAESFPTVMQSAFEGAWAAIRAGAEAALSGIESAFAGIFANVVSGASGIVAQLGAVWTQIVADATATMSGLSAAVVTVWTQVEADTTASMNQIQLSVTTSLTTMEGETTEILFRMKKEFNYNFREIATTVEALSMGMQATFSSMLNTMASDASSKMQEIVATTKSAMEENKKIIGDHAKDVQFGSIWPDMLNGMLETTDQFKARNIDQFKQWSATTQGIVSGTGAGMATPPEEGPYTGTGTTGEAYADQNMATLQQSEAYYTQLMAMQTNYQNTSMSTMAAYQEQGMVAAQQRRDSEYAELMASSMYWSQLLQTTSQGAQQVQQVYDSLSSGVVDVMADTWAYQIAGMKSAKGALQKGMLQMVSGIAEALGEYFVKEGFAMIAAGSARMAMGMPGGGKMIAGGTAEVAAGLGLKALGKAGAMAAQGGDSGGAGAGAPGAVGGGTGIQPANQGDWPGSRESRVTIDMAGMQQKGMVMDMAGFIGEIISEVNNAARRDVEIVFAG
jgi:hypothetical protein